ncbi:hypothetical protein V6N13_100551 [Hibiscus sabdariffa]
MRNAPPNSRDALSSMHGQNTWDEKRAGWISSGDSSSSWGLAFPLRMGTSSCDVVLKISYFKCKYTLLSSYSIKDIDDKGDASAGRQWVLPGQIILAGTSEFGRASCFVTGLSLSPVTACLACLPRQGSRQVTDLLSWRDNLLPWLGGKSSAWAGKSGLAGNMPDFAQICHGRFTNSAPADAIVAALAGSECNQPGTASVQLPIWH